MARRFPTAWLALLLAGWLATTAASAQNPARLEVGYIPILPMSQLFVLEGAGWADEAGLELNLTRFSSGPAIVTALASGTLDVAYYGIGPALVSRARGIDVKVLASNVIEQIAVIARGRLAELAAAHPPADACGSSARRPAGCRSWPPCPRVRYPTSSCATGWSRNWG